MSDMSKAIDVTTSIDIDWAELGRVFADEPSPHQAAFFLGFYEGVVDGQLAFIGADSQIHSADRADVALVYENLAWQIANGGKSA